MLITERNFAFLSVDLAVILLGAGTHEVVLGSSHSLVEASKHAFRIIQMIELAFVSHST